MVYLRLLSSPSTLLSFASSSSHYLSLSTRAHAFVFVRDRFRVDCKHSYSSSSSSNTGSKSSNRVETMREIDEPSRSVVIVKRTSAIYSVFRIAFTKLSLGLFDISSFSCPLIKQGSSSQETFYWHVSTLLVFHERERNEREREGGKGEGERERANEE